MANLEYDFSVTGRRVIDRELASIEQRFAQHNARINRAIATVAPGLRTGRGVNDQARVGREAEREAKRLTAAKAAEERKASQTRVREELAAVRRASKEKISLERENQRQHDYWHRARSGSEQRRFQEERRFHAERVRMISRERAARERFVRSTVGGIGSSIGGMVRTAGTVGMTLAGVGGVGLGAAAIGQAMELDEQSRRISIQGRGKGEAGFSPEALSKRFTQVGIAKGIAPEEVARGVGEFVTLTGDLKGAMNNIDMFATVAQASAAKTEELAGIGAMLNDIMDIKSPEQMREAYAMLVQQGKLGSFELRAMAQDLPQVAGAASRAGVKGMGGLRQLGGLMQVGMSEIRSAPETATAVMTMFRQLAAKSTDIQSGKAFSGRAVKVFEGGDPTKPMRDFIDVLSESLIASRGNIVELQEVFDVRGIKAVSPLVTAFREASNQVRKTGGNQKAQNEAGKKAMVARLEEFNIVGDFSEIERDAADASKSVAVQMSNLGAQLKEAVASQLFPELVRLGPELKQLVPVVRDLTSGLVKATRFFAENWGTGLIALMGLSFAKELARAKIGDLIVRTIVGGAAPNVAGGVAGRVAGGAAGTPMVAGGGKLGGAVALTAAALVGLEVGHMLVNEFVAPDIDRRFKQMGEVADATSDVEAMAKHGAGTEEERAAAAAKLKAELAETEQKFNPETGKVRKAKDVTIGDAMGVLASIFTDVEDPAVMTAKKIAAGRKALEDLEASSPAPAPDATTAANMELDSELAEASGQMKEAAVALRGAVEKIGSLNRGPAPTPAVD